MGGRGTGEGEGDERASRRRSMGGEEQEKN
jgi:hypothetical protein